MRSAVLALVLSLLTPGAAVAIWLEPTPEQVQEALAHGSQAFRQRVDQGLPIDDREEAWEVDLGGGKGVAYLWTPFNTLSREARRYEAIKRPLTPEEVRGFIQPLRDRLVFEVLVYGGPTARFAATWTASLGVGDAVREPVYRDIHPGVPSDVPEARYRAIAVFHFAAEGVDLQGRVTLVLTNPARQELRFPFDLGALR